MQSIVTAAKEVYDNEAATQAEVNAAAAKLDQTNVNSALSAAIAKLIPIGKINATGLYEATTATYSWLDHYAVVNGVTPITQSNTTAASWSAFQSALSSANAELKKLYYQAGDTIPNGKSVGDATPYNSSAEGSDAATNVANAKISLQTAVDGLDQLAVSTALGGISTQLETAKLAYDGLDKLANKLFHPNALQQDRYETNSWSAYETARTDALQFLSTHSRPDDTAGYRECLSYVDAYRAFWSACYEGLTSAASQVSVDLSITDNYDLLSGTSISPYAGTWSLQLDTENATVAGALTAALGTGYDLSNSDNHYQLGVYLNGVYLFNMISTSADSSIASREYSNVRLQDGDTLVVAMMYGPTESFGLLGQERAVAAKDLLSAVQYAYTRITADGQDIRIAEATAGQPVTLNASFMLSHPIEHNGRISSKTGAHVYISEAYATEAEARHAGAAVDTGAVTNSDGSFSLTLYSAAGSKQGWYVVTIVGDGENGGLVNGANLLLHVTDDADLNALKTSAKTALLEIRNAYEDDFYTTEQLAEIQRLYENAITTIDAATDSGTVNNAHVELETAIRTIQQNNAERMERNLSSLNRILAILPSLEELETGLLYQPDGQLLELLFGNDGLYSSRMTLYQKKQLSVTDAALLNALEETYEEVQAGSRTLPARPGFKITLKVIDSSTGQEASCGVFLSPSYSTFSNIRLTDDNRFLFDAVNASVFGDQITEFTLPTDGLYYLAPNCYVTSGDYQLDYIDFGVRDHYMVAGAGNQLYGLRSNTEVIMYVAPVGAADTSATYLSELNAAYNSYSKSDYTTENWALLLKAYESGKTSIVAATGSEAKQVALDAAKTAMQGIAKKASSSGAEIVSVDGKFNAGKQVGTVELTVENTTYPDGAFYNNGNPLIEKSAYPIGEKDSMMTVILRALAEEGYSWSGTGGSDYSIGYLSSISKNGQSMGEFSGESGSGWMGSLNDFLVNEGFTSFTVSSGQLSDGDVVRLMFTQNLGDDLGGRWGNSNTTLSSLETSIGSIVPSFTPGTAGADYDFALLISGSSVTVKLTPTAANKNYLVKTFLNEKVTYNNEGNSFYKRTEYIPVKPGDVIYVGVGERAWPSMNKQGAEAGSYTGTWYALHVINADAGADYVNELIAKLPAAKNITASNSAAVQQQIDNIDAVIAVLSSSEQARVNSATLETAREMVNGFGAFAALKAEIAALPSAITVADKSAVETAIGHYNALADSQKNLLTVAEVNKLFKANNTIKLLTALDKIAATKNFAHTEANTSGEVKAALETWLNGLGLGNDVTVSVAVDAFTAASSSADGSYSATITLSIGEGGKMASGEKSVSGTVEYVKSTDAGVKSVTANGVNAAASGTAYSAVLPFGSDVAAANVVVVPADKATVSTPATSDGGATWTFTVTAEDGTTQQNYTLTLSVNDVITTAVQSSAYIVGNDATPINVTGLVEAVSTDALDLPVGASTVSVWLEVTKTAESGDEVTVNVVPKYSVDGGAAKTVPDAAMIGDATVTLPIAGTANARVLHGDTYLEATGSASGITFAARSGQYTLIPDALIATVTYHLNGGTSTDVTDGQQIPYYTGDTAALPQAERNGYKLKGWYGSTDGSGSPVTAIAADMPGEIWAIWQSSDASATVKVRGVNATASGTVFTVSLPFGSAHPAATDITITPADGATASTPVTEDDGVSWSFTVTAEDGTEKNYTLQVEIAEQTAAEKLAVAKATIEAADWTVAQATANEATALKTFVEDKLAGIALGGASASVTVGNVTPAVAGSKDGPDGTDGSYGFTVALTLGEDSTTASVSNAKITATAYVPPTPPTVTWSEALAGVQAYVTGITPNPTVGSTSGEWAIFALNRGGVATEGWNNKYIGNLQTYVDGCGGVLHDKKYTEYSRVVIALTSIGYDATKFTTASAVYDMVSPLLDKQDNGAYWAEWQGNNGTAFALLALDTHGYLDTDEGNAARAAFIASLKANQLESGAWSISGDAADLDVTAAAVYALAPYYLDSSKLAALGGTVSYAEIKAMVDNALAFLSGKQNAEGGLGSPEADVWTIIALTTLGRDPATETAFVKEGGSLVDDLLRYYDETTGGFKHELGGEVNQMSSEQAAYGLVAYDRFKSGKTALYDMSDVEIAPNVPETPEEADRAAAAAVDELIDAIGTVTLDSESTVTAARTAYDALTATQKALVTKYATLTVAETKLTALKNKDNKPDKDKDKTITVTMRLIGAEKATKDVDLGADSYLPNYVTWIPTTSYTLEKGSSVYDLWTVATADYGIRSVGAENNYVETVYAPSGYALSEFTNGPRSGWMYTINGRHPGFGLCEQELYDGDVVIWHYVNDYSYEVEDWFKDDPNYPALGDGTYWNLWLKAPDSTGGTGGGVASGEKKDKKETGDGSYTTTSTQNVTADDGSQVTVETEKTVETKENDDGSVTETVTETTKTTVVSPDGKKTVTETVAEAQTVRKSEEFADGSVTETESTVEKVTETVTGADGTKQTTVTETEETKKVNTTTAGGKTSGTGTYSAKTTVTGADGKKTTAVTEGNVTVSTNDKGTVSEVTTAKTTTTAPDGTKTETTEIITEAEMTNGTTGKVVADEQGNTISAEATVSEAALEAAQNGDGVIEIPVTVNPDSGATVRIHLPELAAGKHAWVEIGTTVIGSGNVAYLKLGDVTKLLSTCKTGSVIVPVTGDCEVIVKDNSKAFSDVDAAAWYGDSVKFVTAREIFNGNGDGTFAPSATMNRAMAAQILYNLDGSAKAGDGTRFSDVTAGDWFNGAVGWASGLGVINGYNGAYAPLDAVTRQDLVTILYRYAKQAGYNVSVGTTVNLLTYADGADVKDYAQEAMRWAIAVGLVKGYEDNTLRPTATATRAEVAAIMQRLVQNAVK